MSKSSDMVAGLRLHGMDRAADLIEKLERDNERMRLNLCPHSLRYGRTCDDGPTDEEIDEFLSR